MSILKDISALVDAEVISQETGDRIRKFYAHKKGSTTSRLVIIFGVLGSLLVGLGIILIIAHNWDELSTATKTFFAFLPLLAGQIACAGILAKKQDSVAWLESGCTFLFFAVGASIALVSQIYHIPGNTADFLLTWMLLCLPLIYVMKSSVVALLYVIGITYYAAHLGYWTYPSSNPYLYWLLFIAALPHYYLLSIRNPESNFTVFHHWVIPLSLIITLGTLAENKDELMFIAYFSLFGLLYQVGNLDSFAQQKTINNGYKFFGSLGTIVLLLMLSFDWYWKALRTKTFSFSEVVATPEFSAAAVLSLLAGTLLLINRKGKALNDVNVIEPVFLLFIATFFIGTFSPIAVVLMNVFVLAMGILTIRAGAKDHHLGVLNYGLLIITTLVVCRFFDSDLSFVVRGLLFVTVGTGFFFSNYWLLQKRKANEQ